MRRSFSFCLILLFALITTAARSTQPVAAQDCTDDAELVEQTLDPATDSYAPGAPFTVSWTVRNSGDCSWNRSYRLIFVSGERMEGPRSLRLPKAVEPGEELTLALDLTAPTGVDKYSGRWQLRNAGGDNFGPQLTVSIQVGSTESANADVVLPEVLVFGGMGAPGDPAALLGCVEEGALPASPTLMVNDDDLQYRFASLLLCSFSEGAEVTVTLTSPAGESFSRSYVEDAPVTVTDDTGSSEEAPSYTGTVMLVPLTWLVQAPSGDWQVSVSGDELTTETTLQVPEPLQNSDEGDYAELDNWPSAPVDPFAGAGGCHYQYLPGQEMMVSGDYFPPDTTLQLGFYHTRFGSGYFADQVAVQTDENGSFVIPYEVMSEPGNYNIVAIQKVDPEAFLEGGEQYDLGLSQEQTGFTCFSVALASPLDPPIRLALAAGNPGNSDIVVYDYETGEGYYPTFSGGVCDASEPAWWPDGEWVLYQSNCMKDEKSQVNEMLADGDYDLYAVQIDPTYTIPEADKLVQLTNTPDVDETEPDSNSDGVIVYRQSPAGSPLDASGELWLWDFNDDSSWSLDLFGREPAWSPDGGRIAFMSDVDGTWQIYLYDVETEDLSLVSEGCRTQCRMPSWSPDGEQIIYEVSVGAEDDTPAALWIATADGSSKPRRFLTGEYGRPSWSSAGWIVFEGPNGIFRAAPTRRPEVERYFYSDPSWTNYWSPVWSK